MELDGARTESMFREANEKLRGSRVPLAADHERTPFLCECEDVRCTTMLLLTVAEYESGRESGDSFLIAPGHDDGAGGEALKSTARYVLVRKSGRAGALARGLDPRT
jgi:hypothetical protein